MGSTQQRWDINSNNNKGVATIGHSFLFAYLTLIGSELHVYKVIL